MTNLRPLFAVALAGLAAGLLASTVSARAAGPAAAAPGTDPLQGIKEGKVVYDITDGDAKALLVRLETIEETRQDLVRQGVTPRFVLSFRGGATLLLQSDLARIKPDDRALAAQLATRVAELSKAAGVEGLEQCAVAIRHAGTRAQDVVAPIRVVANSFVTIMAWQARGYAYIRT